MQTINVKIKYEKIIEQLLFDADTRNKTLLALNQIHLVKENNA